MAKYEAQHTVDVNGVTLHYAKVGEGRPIILIHGNAEDHNLFETEIGQLVEAGYQVYAPDSRGHGANIPLDEYHYADMAEDMYQFIRAMGLEPATPTEARRIMGILPRKREGIGGRGRRAML